MLTVLQSCLFAKTEDFHAMFLVIGFSSNLLNNICLLIHRTGFYLSIILEILRFIQIIRYYDSLVSISHDIPNYL